MTAANVFRPAPLLLSALALVGFVLATPASRAGDESPISLSTVTPTSGQTVAGKITWEVAARERGPSMKFVEFFIDGQLKWTEHLAPYVYNGDGAVLDTTTLSNGTHELRAVGTDERGRTKTVAVQVNVANLGPLPQVSIPEPANAATLSGTVKWFATVSGASAQRVEFLIDGELKWTEQFAAYGYGGDAGLLDTTRLSNGAHTLKNVAYAADGRSTSASVTVNVATSSSPPLPPPPPPPSAPKSTAPPAISGTPSVGATLSSTLGSWTGTEPISYTRQWERCTTTCSPISGATAAYFVVANADVDFKLRVTVKAVNAAGSATAASAQTEAVTAPSAAPQGRSFTGWDASLRPAFTPRRTITVTSKAAFDAAWANLQPGDKLLVSGITFTGQVDLGHKRLGDWAEIHFADDVRFTGGGARLLNAAWIKDGAYLRFYGGDLANSTGHGFRIEDSNDILWWGFRVHDVGGTCSSVFGITRVTERLDIRGECWRNGQDLTMDPHAEKGTGLHGLYLGGGSYRTSGTFVLKAHDLPAGAAVQAGPHLQDSVIEVDARRITKVATSQVGGNAVQWWGDDIRNVRVPYVYGEDLAGRVSEPSGLYQGSNPAGAIVIEYGRSGGTIRLSPRYASTSDGSVRCVDCQ